MTEQPGWQPSGVAVVRHHDGSHVGLRALDALFADWAERQEQGAWENPDLSDRWLAPRVHYALRLTRAQAADRWVWLWLALRFHGYIEWRWGGTQPVNELRWSGGINKQAIARLWWGAEIFRNGSDYRPVERAFVRQDLTNSVLHRPVVGCRPLALAMVFSADNSDDSQLMSGDEINQLAGVLNLATAGSPPEATTGYPLDDAASYAEWIRQAPAIDGWDLLPGGPPVRDVTAEQISAGQEITSRCMGFAEDYARLKGSRSAERTARRREPAPQGD
jgi:uncharacterized protein DUF6339